MPAVLNAYWAMLEYTIARIKAKKGLKSQSKFARKCIFGVGNMAKATSYSIMQTIHALLI